MRMVVFAPVKRDTMPEKNPTFRKAMTALTRSKIPSPFCLRDRKIFATILYCDYVAIVYKYCGVTARGHKEQNGELRGMGDFCFIFLRLRLTKKLITDSALFALHRYNRDK